MAHNTEHQPKCVVLGCGKNAQVKTKNADGTRLYRLYCTKHHKMRTRIKVSKKHFCENRDGHLGFHCTSTIVDSSQLSIDHIDGNRDNNNPENLQTLCFNCHALKTKMHDNHLNRYSRQPETTFNQIFKYTGE